MFEHFTFGALAQPNPHPEDEASPTDTSFWSTSCPLILPQQAWDSYYPLDEVNTLISDLSRSSLHPAASPDTESESSLPSMWRGRDHVLPIVDAASNMDVEFMEEMSYVSLRTGSVRVPAYSHQQTQSVPNTPTMPTNPRTETITCRRLQRQLNMQLQSCSDHVRDLHALVEEMVAGSSQCRLSPKPVSRQYPSIPSRLPEGPALVVDDRPEFDGDEGFAEITDEDMNLELGDDEFSLRRASTPSGIRKHNILRFRRSAECGGNGNGNGHVLANGRLKVRSVPRMRKKKVKTVPE